MEIKRVPISQVEPWDKNPRNIKTKDFERLKKQILELGIYKPLICYKEGDKYITLGGNMRLLALRELGIPEVEISIVHPKSEAEKIKYNLSDNDRAGEYDDQALAELIYPHQDEIQLEDFKVDLGEALDLREIINAFGPGLEDFEEEEIPEVDDGPAITQPGDLYRLGKHRLLCGDSTKPENISRLMAGEKADLVFTDPPYNYKEIRGAGIFKEAVLRVAEKIEHISKFDPSQFLSVLPTLFKDQVLNIYIFCNKDLIPKYLNWALENKANFDILTWHKKSIIPLGGHHHYPDTEYIIFIRKNAFFKSGLRSEYYKKYFILNNEKSEEHPTIKPIEIALTEITISSQENSIIHDGFLGSGTTLIACEKLNRQSETYLNQTLQHRVN